MRANIGTRYEVYMSDEEQKMLNRVIDWIEETLNCTDDCDAPELPEVIIEMLSDIYDDIVRLLKLIPR